MDWSDIVSVGKTGIGLVERIERLEEAFSERIGNEIPPEWQTSTRSIIKQIRPLHPAFTSTGEVGDPSH